MVVRDKTMYVEVIGEVPGKFVDFVKHVVENFYTRVGRKPELLEIYVYESTQLKLRELSRTALELGISVICDYPLAHEAWIGWPRIHIDYEKCRQLNQNTLRALLVHECTHSLLHGSLDSYIVQPSRELVEVLGDTLVELLYLASTIVKDLEVHEYLVTHGFTNEVREYYEYTSRDLVELDCKGVKDLLVYAKLVSPCMVLDCKPGIGDVTGSSCTQYYNVIRDVLLRVNSLKCGLNCKVVELLRSLALTK